MNVRVGDIIKLENNQFVAVRDQLPRRPAGASFSLAQRDECRRLQHPWKQPFPSGKRCVTSMHEAGSLLATHVLGTEHSEGGGGGARGVLAAPRGPHAVFSAGGPPPPVQQRAPRAVLHRDSGARRVSHTPLLLPLG